MKYFKLLLILALISPLTSCKNPTSSGDLTIQVGPQNAQVLPLSMKSCEDTANASTSASLQKAVTYFTLFKFSWAGSKEFQAQYILLEIESGFLNQKYVGYILGDELYYAMNGKIIIPGGTDATYTTACGLRFGGISFKTPGRPAFLAGTLTVYGIEVDADGNSSPVYSEAQVTLQYDGDPAED